MTNRRKVLKGFFSNPPSERGNRLAGALERNKLTVRETLSMNRLELYRLPGVGRKFVEYAIETAQEKKPNTKLAKSDPA